MSSQLRTRLLLIVAIVAVIVGTGIVMTTRSQSASYGWFAYAPLSSTIFLPDGVHIISTGGLVGTAVLAVGLIALVSWAGLRIAHRRSPGHD